MIGALRPSINLRSLYNGVDAFLKPLDVTALRRATSDVPGWLSELRRRAYDHFEKLTMPVSQEEAWKYVDLGFDLADFGLVEGPGTPQPVDAFLASIGDPAGTLSIVDGLAAAATDVKRASFGSLAAAAGSEVGQRLAESYGAGVAVDRDIFAAAAQAFGTDGAYIGVASGIALERPLLVDVQAVTPGAVSFPRTVINVDDSSQASVIVYYRSPDRDDLIVVPDVDVVLGTNAHLKLTVVQHWGDATRAVSHLGARIGRDASLHLAEAGLGSRLARLDLRIDLEGRGSSANIVGVYFGERDQVLDYRYLMHHAGLNTRSDMFLKGAVEDDALSVFTGLIRIDEGAQRTDAFQTNRNLLLSDGASAQSVPTLEILADDIRCGHGSTVGPLDAGQRYYLMSRGLDGPRADRLQVRGFFQEALNRFPEPDVVAPLRRWINEKYIAAQAEGRV